MQNPGEGIDAYTIRHREAAIPCEFGKTTENLILLHIAIGSRSEKVRQKALAEQTTLTELIAFAKSQEVAPGAVHTNRQFDDRVANIKTEQVFQTSNNQSHGQRGSHQAGRRYQAPNESKPSHRSA